MPADSSDSNPKQASKGAGEPLLFLAPIAGYSDAAFRSLCREQGAALCYTEMVSSEALVRSHPKTQFLLDRYETESEYAIQLFGSSPEVLARAAELVTQFKPAIIDLNCGCPVPKIVRTGAGSALLKMPEKIARIVSAMRGASDIPVTVKIRTGWDEKSINFLETADAAVSAGAAAVTLHGRTRAQGYGGKADWDAIATLVSALAPRGVPVYGSGDVFGAEAPARMRALTGVAGVMIARGAIGNPFIFAQARAVLEGVAPRLPDDAEVARVAGIHLERSVRFLGERTACVEFRKQFCAYTKGRKGGAALRDRAVHCSTKEEFSEVLAAFASGDY